MVFLIFQDTAGLPELDFFYFHATLSIRKRWIMKKIRKKLIISAGAVILAGVLSGVLRDCSALQKNSVERSTFTFRTMGTVGAVTLTGNAHDTAPRGNELVMKAFEEVVRTANLYDPDSELSRLNATAADKEFFCSELMWKMIKEAQFAWKFSGGAFDITVKPLMNMWGFYRKRNQAPGQHEINETMKKTGFDKLILDDSRRSVRFRVKGMALDLGGIAKGFALDLAAERLAEIPVSGVLDLGGNLKFTASAPDGKKSYTVGIKDPSDPGRLRQTVPVSPGQAVSTSGDYERNITYGGRIYGHIIDPACGYPPVRRYSATVIAPSAMRADWLSTAVFLRGEVLENKIREQLPECRVIMVKK